MLGPLITRLTLVVEKGRGWRGRKRRAVRAGQAHWRDLIMDPEVDGAHFGRVAGAAQRQVAPFILLDRPDRAVLVQPIRIGLVGEADPSGQYPTLPSVRTR